MSAPNPERRSERARQAILKAAWELAGDLTYDRLTIEAIAARAGVGKQTIYRWWPSKAYVLIEALNLEVGTVTDFPDTGEVTADLRQQMVGVVGLLTDPGFGRPYTGLIAAAQSDPEVARAVVDEIIEPRVAACRDRLKIAQDAGQLRADVDLDEVVELLYGPIYHRLVLHTFPITVEQVDNVVAMAFNGLRPGKPPRRSRTSTATSRGHSKKDAG